MGICGEGGKMRLEDFKKVYFSKFKRVYENGGDKWHVKALCYCRYKVLNEPYEVVASKPAVAIGQLVHYAVERLSQYEAKTFEKSVGKYTVYGTPDLYDGDVVEVKFTRFVPKEPRPHDVLQLRLYLWLLGLERGYLWYLSPDDWVEFEVKGSVSDEDVIELIENPKYPMWSWECKHCSLKDNCPYRKIEKFI